MGLRDFLNVAAKRLADAAETQAHGKVNTVLVCPHCQGTECVRTKPIERKTGLSGGKVAAAVLLSPLTLLATGLSKAERAAQAHCDRCQSTWTF